MHLYKTINETHAKLESDYKQINANNYPEPPANITEAPLPQNNWTSLETESVIPTKITLENSTKMTMSHNVVSALMDVNATLDQSNHQLMLLILIGLFMLISLCLTIAVLVFCKKKNSVFMLQKCEQDSEYELDDINNTEVENTDSEYEDLDAHSDPRRSETYPCLSKVTNDGSFGKYSEKCLQKDNSQSDSGSPATIPLLRTSNVNLVDSQGNKSKTTQRPSLKKSFTFSTSQECKKLLKQQKIADNSGLPSSVMKQRNSISESLSTVEYEGIETDDVNEEYSNTGPNYHTNVRHNSEPDNFSTNFSDGTTWPSDMTVHTVEATIEHHDNIGDSGLAQEDDVLDFSGKLEIL